MVNTAKLQEEFETLVKTNIKRDGIGELLKYLESSDFYTSPASTQYHGSYAGGLVEHSINVYYCLTNYLQYLYGPNWEKAFSLETVTIVSLFHDLCKIGRYKPGTRNVKDPKTGQWNTVPTYLYNTNHNPMGHGAASVFIIQRYLNLTEDEIGAIYWHMGAFDLGTYNSVGDLGNHMQKHTLTFALHIADMEATYIVENPDFTPVDYEPTDNNTPSTTEVKN